MAHVIEVTNKAMDATQRCDRCGAQAWVEALIVPDSEALLFCAYHARQHWDALMALPGCMVADHRATLIKQEGGQRDAAAAPR